MVGLLHFSYHQHPYHLNFELHKAALEDFSEQGGENGYGDRWPTPFIVPTPTDTCLTGVRMYLVADVCDAMFQQNRLA